MILYVHIRQRSRYQLGYPPTEWSIVRHITFQLSWNTRLISQCNYLIFTCKWRERKGCCNSMRWKILQQCLWECKDLQGTSKCWHDKHIMLRDFKKGKKVLFFNSHLRLFPGKLRSRWSDPFEVTQVLPHGAIEIHSLTKGTFKVNGQRLKPYIEGDFTKHNVSFLLDEAS